MDYHSFRFFLKGMDSWVDRMHSLTVRLNRSISGTCSFLDTQFRDIPRSAISACRGSKSLSACMSGFLKLRCRYSLWICLIPSSMLFFLFLIILPVANIMCQDMVLRKPMPLMCMKPHHRVNFLYLSRIPLGKFGTMIGYTC